MEISSEIILRLLISYLEGGVLKWNERKKNC